MSELEYIRFMLVAMKKVDGELFDDLHKQFLHIDMTGDGKITKKDLQIMAARKLRRVSHKLQLSEYKVCIRAGMLIFFSIHLKISKNVVLLFLSINCNKNQSNSISKSYK